MIRNLMISGALLATTLLAAYEDERAMMNRNTATLSASLLIGELRNTFARRTPDCDLAEPMRNAPARYTDASAAGKLLAQDYSAKLQSEYAAEAEILLDEVRKKYSGYDNSDVLPPEFVLDAVRLPASCVQENLANVYPQQFKQARERVCAEQRTKIVGSVFPSEADVDGLSEPELVSKLESRMMTTWEGQLYNENRSFVRESIVAPIVKEALEQKSEQLAVVENAGTSEALTPADYERELTMALQNLIARRRANPSERKTYEVFPSVKRLIPKKAKELTLKKFAAGMPDYAPSLSSGEILDEIVGAPANYKTAEQTARRFYASYKERTTQAAMRSYLAAAPAALRREVGELITASLINEPECDRILTPFFESKVLPEVNKVRGNVAKAQFRQLFPALADGSWVVPDDELETARRDRKRNPATRWRQIEGVKVDSATAANLMDETEKLVEQAVTASFELALRSFDRQMNIADDQYAAMKSIMENLQRDGKQDFRERLSEYLEMTPDVEFTSESLANAALNRVYRLWDQRRIVYLWPQGTARPENYEQLYRELFPAVRDAVVRNAKAIYSELENLMPEQFGERRGNFSAKIVNCNVEVSENSAGLSVAVWSPQNPLVKQMFQFTPPANAELREQALEEFSGEVARFAATMTENLQIREPTLVQVFIRVRSGDIPYATVAELRQTIRKELRGASPKGGQVSFRVSDELKLDR